MGSFEQLVESFRRIGLDPTSAEMAASRGYGNVMQAREAYRRQDAQAEAGGAVSARTLDEARGLVAAAATRSLGMRPVEAQQYAQRMQLREVSRRGTDGTAVWLCDLAEALNAGGGR